MLHVIDLPEVVWFDPSPDAETITATLPPLTRWNEGAVTFTVHWVSSDADG